MKRFKPDAVILDLMLPKLNGLEVLKVVRADAATKSLPVVVLSNAYLSATVQEAWKAGADQCMIKASCTPRQLIDVVNRLCQNPAASPIAAARNLKIGPNPSAPAPEPSASNSRPPAAAEEDANFQAGLRQNFLKGGQEQMAQLRGLLQAFIKSEGHSTRMPRLLALYRRIHSLTGNSALAGLTNFAKMSSALEALLNELYEKPKSINASAMRTVAHTVDFLAVLLARNDPSYPENPAEPNILVVDDEALSRRAVIFALDKAQLKCVGVEDPKVALTLLAENRFDLIFLDVDMPGMNGFELCTRLRALPTQARTPVVFVTGLTDFESRARSTLSGGNDLIAKPFLFMELAVKALTHVLRGQLGLNRN